MDKYTWVALSSSFLPSDLLAAFLYAQLEMSEEIAASRSRLIQMYVQGLKTLEDENFIRLPAPDSSGGCQSMYIITGSLDERNRLIQYLATNHIKAIFHYTPLHTSPMGRKYCRTHGSLPHTTRISDSLARLPLYNDMKEDEVTRVVEAVKAFYQQQSEACSR